MALPKTTAPAQRDFSAGQISASALRRDDLKLFRRGLRTALNTRMLATGPVSNRFGRSARFPGSGRTEKISLAGATVFTVTFGNGTVVIRDSDDEQVASFSGFPWTLSTLGDIVYTAYDSEFIVTFPGMRPRIFRYGRGLRISPSLGSTIGDFTASEGLAGAFDGLVGTRAQKNSATSGYLGLNLSAAPQRFGSAVITPNATDGFVNNDNPSVTFTIRGKNGSAPSSLSDGTSLGTTGAFTDSTAVRTITSTDTVTEWDYLWLQMTHNGVANHIFVAELNLATPGDTNLWTSLPFVFDTAFSGETRQPYYRYAPRGITASPSARTGSITLTFDAAVLNASHVGISFRYHGHEMRCTAVTSDRAGTFSVVGTLPPTKEVLLTSAESRNSFKVGETVIGQSSGSEGLITAFSSTDRLVVIVYKGANFISGDRLVSPSGIGFVSGTPPDFASIAASPVWDEALMSDYRGWPRSVRHDRSRVTFCDFPGVPNGIVWSAVAAYSDFLVGTAATDAMFELMSGTPRVRHVIGGADQFILSDKGAHYIPISTSSPLAPGSIDFRSIGSIAASGVQPVEASQGVVYAAENGKSVVGIVPTGQTAFPYRLANLSEFHDDLFSGINCFAVQTSGGASSTEQYLWVGNNDGTAVVGRFDQSNEWVGFIPINGGGSLEWISAYGSEVLFSVLYTAPTVDYRVVEEIDENMYLDCAVVINDPPAALDGSVGQGPLHFLAGATVSLMDGNAWLGDRAVDSNGDVVEESGDDFSGDDIVAGIKWTSTVVPFVPEAEEGPTRRQRTRRRRIARAVARVRNTTGFTWGRRDFGAYSEGETPELLTGTYRSSPPGRSFDPQVTFSKTIPGPFEISELTIEASV